MKKILTTSLLLAQVVFAATAGAVQLFDFDAQAILPATVPGTATVYGVIVNGAAVDAPIPLDFANHQYTIVIGLIRETDGTTSTFTHGDGVFIYEDAATAADWSDPASFTDGAVILSGVLGTLQHTMATATLGSAAGYVDWTGGTRLNDLAPADQSGWPFLTAVSRAASQVQPGFTEQWDGKLEPTGDVVATEAQSWAGVKALYR